MGVPDQCLLSAPKSACLPVASFCSQFERKEQGVVVSATEQLYPPGPRRVSVVAPEFHSAGEREEWGI